MISEVLIVAFHYLPASWLGFTESIPRILPPVRGDRVLLNLLLNALQAIPLERRVVEIDEALAGALLHIQVADRGPGIPVELAEQVLAPFFTTKPDGLGLGLNICRTIVESHRGRFTFADRVGGGRCLPWSWRSMGERSFRSLEFSR